MKKQFQKFSKHFLLLLYDIVWLGEKHVNAVLVFLSREFPVSLFPFSLVWFGGFLGGLLLLFFFFCVCVCAFVVVGLVVLVLVVLFFLLLLLSRPFVLSHAFHSQVFWKNTV